MFKRYFWWFLQQKKLLSYIILRILKVEEHNSYINYHLGSAPVTLITFFSAKIPFLLSPILDHLRWYCIGGCCGGRRAKLPLLLSMETTWDMVGLWTALSCTDKSPTLMHLFTSSVVAKSPRSPRDESNTSKTLSLSHNSQTWKEATNYSCGHMESNWGYIYGDCRKLTFLKRSTCSEDIGFYTRETHINCKYWR